MKKRKVAEAVKKDAITKVDMYLSLTTLVLRLSPDCMTEKDAEALIKAGVVSVNDRINRDIHAGVIGDLELKIGHAAPKPITISVGKRCFARILKLVNRPAVLAKLREGGSKRASYLTPAGRNNFHLMLAPPFNGDTIIACQKGAIVVSPQIISRSNPGKHITECGMRRL